jgi:CBS domain containing-hemolysin-like protein
MVDENGARIDPPQGASEQPAGGATGQPASSWLQRLRSRLGFEQPLSPRETLEHVIGGEGGGEKSFAPQERAMLLRALRFGELRVDDVMVPRADIVALDISASLHEMLGLFKKAGHSRIPVYSETLDDLRGMVHIKDLVAWMMDRAGGSTGEKTEGFPALSAIDMQRIDLATPIGAAKILRAVLFVPPSMPALNLLLRMQSTHVHLAMVVDEYGGTDGLVSIEDLVEQIVGDIEDEHDDAETELISGELATGLIASARAPIADLERIVGVKLVDADDEEDFDTLAGLVFSLVGRVPVRGEVVRHPSGIEFEVLDADPRRIKKLKVHNRATPPAGVNGESDGDTSG